MKVYRSGIIVLCGLFMFAALYRLTEGHTWTEMDWLSAMVVGLGVWIAWMLSDVMKTLQAILEELRRR